MKSGKLNKMATTLIVLFLVMSGLMVVQWNAQPVEATEHENEEYTYTIEGFIDPMPYVPIESDLEIKLKSLSTGETWNEYTSEDYYEFTDVTPGYYEIIFSSQIVDDIAYMRTTEAIEISDEDIIKDIEVDTDVIDHTLEFNVTTEEGPVEDLDEVTITLQNRTRGFYHDNYEVVCEENATFEIDIYSGFSGSLMVEKEGYAPNFTHPVNLDENSDKTILEDITLRDTPVLEGRLVDQDGRGIREKMQITLYNKDIGLLQRTKEGPTFRIRAPIDYDYILVVDTPGYRPLVNDSISFDEENREINLDKNTVYESEPEMLHTDIVFDYDEETEEDNLTVTTNRSIRAGTKMETLDYSSIGNLAMQIDLALGDGDGNLTEAEVEKFKERLNYTTNITSTPEFITVNETVFELKNYTAEFSENFTDKLKGNINASNLFEGEIYFNTTRIYEPVEIGPGRHIIDLNVEHDRMYGNRRNYTYEIHLREDYERYRGEDTEEHIPNVDVIGYTKLTIDPHEVDLEEDLRSWITLDIIESDLEELEIILERQPWRFEKKEGYYVVRNDTELQLTADYRGRDDFLWFLDGEEIDEGIEITHRFNKTGEWNLIARTEDEKIEGNVTVLVDGEGPRVPDDTPYIVVNDENISVDETDDLDERTAYVNETEEVEFNATYFEDIGTGQVDWYEWNFSDDSGIHDRDVENITHVFDVPGEYNVNLNVTDAVGNWNDDNNITVRVMDITEPEGDFSIEWNDNSTYEPTVRMQRGVTNVTFNGTEIIAHPEEYEGSALHYNWTLIDEDANETLRDGITESNWTYEEFTEAGEYTIRLNVSDEGDFSEGNYREIEKTIIIERGPVPDLMVHDLEFSDENPRVGDTITISVNVTNIGDLKAEDIHTNLTVNGVRVTIDEVRFYQDGEELNITEIAQGETVTIRFEWEPEEDGENMVNVTITDAEEPEDLWYDNNIEETITVDPPAWRQYVVYALIPIIIIGVVVGLYLFKDRLTEMLR